MTNSNTPRDSAIIHGRAVVSVLRGFEVLEKKAGWFERLLIRILRYSYRQRLRHLLLVLPPDVFEEIIKQDLFWEENQ